PRAGCRRSRAGRDHPARRRSSSAGRACRSSLRARCRRPRWRARQRRRPGREAWRTCSCSVRGVSTVAFDVEAVRDRFSSLRSGFAFFDGPGGTQVPDSVIDAVSTYYRESNANVGGPYETSRRTEAVIAQARLAAASFVGCDADEVVFGPNMTTLNFALTRTAAREYR